MKPKIAFFDFASCEGDQLQVVNLEEDLLALLGHVDVVEFREAMKEQAESYDIAFIEGSITRKADEERLKDIRARSKLLVAFGACAAIGGINCLKNHMPEETYKKMVYGDKADWYDTYPARPVDAVVKVDAKVHGCPINRPEFVSIVKALLMGKKPDIANYPVCVECKKNENVCSFERNEFCMGPVTRAGCNSTCVNEGAVCWGCRGLVDDPNKNSHKEVLSKYGLTTDEVAGKFRLYTAYQAEVKDDK